MPYQIENANVSMYAEDHQLYTMGKDFNAIRDSLQIEGQRASDWYKDTYLLANSEKFQALVINPRNINTNMESMDVSIDGQIIKTTDDQNYNMVDSGIDICTITETWFNFNFNFQFYFFQFYY